MILRLQMEDIQLDALENLDLIAYMLRACKISPFPSLEVKTSLFTDNSESSSEVGALQDNAFLLHLLSTSPRPPGSITWVKFQDNLTREGLGLMGKKN